jgi:hypothetical protein
MNNINVERNLLVSSYKDFVTITRDQVGTNNAHYNFSIDSFEPNFFHNMVLALDRYFVHRMRGLEKKDGNPLNEVRMLCDSIMINNNIMSLDNTIKYDPAKSVLKYKVGDEIKLNEKDFELISEAFFQKLKVNFCELKKLPR